MTRDANPDPDARPSTRLIFATAPDGDAAALVRAMVEARLVACGNILPGARAIYRWDGAVQDDAESVLLMETDADRLDEAIARLAQLHPYEVPKIIALPPAAVLPAYATWVSREVADADAEPA